MPNYTGSTVDGKKYVANTNRRKRFDLVEAINKIC